MPSYVDISDNDQSRPPQAPLGNCVQGMLEAVRTRKGKRPFENMKIHYGLQDLFEARPTSMQYRVRELSLLPEFERKSYVVHAPRLGDSRLPDVWWLRTYPLSPVNLRTFYIQHAAQSARSPRVFGVFPMGVLSVGEHYPAPPPECHE